jgi:alpha-L-fucosidase
MKTTHKIAALFGASVFVTLATSLAAPPTEPDLDGIRCASEADYEWWREARFGVFIHWGPGAFVHGNSLPWPKIPGRPSWHELGYMADHNKVDELSVEEVQKYYKQYKAAGKNGIPTKPEIYNSLYKIYNPVNFDADKIVKMAKDAGAGYVVFTTKHHDGFCMWDSAYTDYDMMSTPAKRDICKELSDACQKYGLRLLWYYSVVDMHDARYDLKNPKAYEDYMFNQVQELLTKYGSIEGMWWDGGKIKKDNERLFKMMNKLQPGILTNGRIGKVPCGVSFGSPEQKLGSFNMDRPWETCAVVTGYSWIWNGGDDIKSLDTCLQTLVGCAVGDGNLLLNFGPEPDGTLTPKVQELYQGIGGFLKEYGESIYKTRGGPYKPGRWGGATRQGKSVYLHITQRWPSGVLELPALPAKIVSAECLTGGEVEYTQTADQVVIKIDPKYHRIPDTIVKLTLETDAMDIEPIETMQGLTLTVDAQVTASSSINLNSKKGAPETVVSYSFETGKVKKEFGEESEVKEIKINHQTGKTWTKEEKDRILQLVGSNHRGHFWRYWQPKPNDKQPWIELDLGHSETFSKVGIRELFGQVRGFKIQAWDGNEWKTFYQGNTMDTLFVDLGESITAQRVRLVILGNNGEVPNLVEFDLFK